MDYIFKIIKTALPFPFFVVTTKLERSNVVKSLLPVYANSFYHLPELMIDFILSYFFKRVTKE